MRSQYRTVCPETGKLNTPGSDIFYCARDKRGYHHTSKRYEIEKMKEQGMDVGYIDVLTQLYSYFK
jgi:hypothetical protein